MSIHEILEKDGTWSKNNRLDFAAGLYPDPGFFKSILIALEGRSFVHVVLCDIHRESKKTSNSFL